MDLPNAKYFKSRRLWRKWLEKNHNKKSDIWLAYYKKHTGKPSVSHEEAVEEALCFGWIDSKVISIDKERFMQKYTPRKPKSVWSLINKKAAEKMMNEGKMMAAGLKRIEEARKNGRWSGAYTSRTKMRMPQDLKKALMGNKKAYKNFNNFANSYQNMYIGWVLDAKRDETRKKHIKEVVKRSAQNKKSGYM